jgi:2-polyprenyl-6-methoxyphenol hydroxylase-like FAD-dependent oxidoreductase
MGSGGLPVQKSDTDVLVVGAGPVGLTMAAALHQHGLTCRIIDEAAEPSDKSKALVVWSRTLELLDNLEVAEKFVQCGLKARGASVYTGGKRVVHISIGGVESPFGFPLMIPQNETERLLTAHLAQQGVAVERSVELVSLSEKTEAVACALRHADGREESLTVPWVAGCDGAHSTVRHALGVPFTGHAEPNDWMLADVHVEGPLPNDEVAVFWHQKGVLVTFPINRDRFRVIADLGLAANTDKPPDPTLAEVQTVVNERGPGGLTLSQPIWLAGFRINERKVTDYRRGRVMLAGDSAHIHSPAGGQGMNTGMQDAFNLAWKLALVHRGRGKTEALLESYSRERSVVGDQVLRGAEQVTTMATLRNPVAQYVRNHVAGIVASFGFVQDKLKNAICELSINYRQGPLSAEDWHAGKGEVAAGDRLPDAPLASAQDGGQTTLFKTIHGTRHNLLLLPGSHDGQALADLVNIVDEAGRIFPDIFTVRTILPPGPAKLEPNPNAGVSKSPVWIDTQRRLHQKLGATDRALIVVRPDRYIGYRAQPAETQRLLNYLDRYLIRKTS